MAETGQKFSVRNSINVKNTHEKYVFPERLVIKRPFVSTCSVITKCGSGVTQGRRDESVSLPTPSQQPQKKNNKKLQSSISLARSAAEAKQTNHLSNKLIAKSYDSSAAMNNWTHMNLY